MQRPRSLGDVLGTGALAGLLAGAAAGGIDAVWSWAPAAQFAPGLGGRLRFVAYAAASYGAAGLAAGLAVTAVALALLRGTHLGELVRFAVAAHRERRARDPRGALAGLALVVGGLPVAAAALYVAYAAMVPIAKASHAMNLVVLSAFAAALGALGAALVLAFVAARAVEPVLRLLVRRAPWLASPWTPPAAAAGLLAAGAALWAWRAWETARLLHLRGELVAAVACALAAGALRPAAALAARLGAVRAWPRRAAWAALPVVLLVAILVTGGSAQVVKAATNFTGLGAPIARALRTAFDRDRDGYARFLGGGDCDDSDPTIHPGAPEIPDDGIDQNCNGTDAHAEHHTLADAGFVPVPASVPKDFDVLLITIDTTRADHLGMYGYKRDTSPNLDRLAKDGTVFVNGWAHAPSTRYSMPAILTGRMPLDVYYDYSVPGWPGILPKATTLAEALDPLGFVSGAITPYWYFERNHHFDQGFAEYDNSDEVLHNGVTGAGPEETRGSSSKQQSDKAISFIDRHAGQRWFLWVHYYDPHYSYEPHPEVPSFGTDRMALYDGEIRFTDLHIGRVLDDLRAKGLYDKTVVVVTGDHGEGFGEHGVYLHGYHLYAAQTKVPLIIRVPGLPPRRSLTPAGHVDIMPTLVNLAGGQPTLDMMGRSLVDLLAGAPDHDRTIFQQLSYENHHEMRAGVDQRCHVIDNISPDASWEVYRIDRDPAETADLADGTACAGTRHAVAQWYDDTQVPPGAAAALLPARPAIAHPLDADLGTSVRLLALDAPAQAHAGEPITLTWTFEARGRVAPGWKLFVHVQGPGRMFVNGDHEPARPFEWWKAGQFIRYTTTLTVPRGYPPGTYTVWTGMFRGQARAHVSAPHAAVGADQVAAATIEVVP